MSAPRAAAKPSVPPALRGRLTRAVEHGIAGDYRVRDTAARIAHLFGDELLQRLAARAANKAKGATA
jgi:hypothetical protein